MNIIRRRQHPQQEYIAPLDVSALEAASTLEAEIEAEMRTIQRYAPPVTVEEIGTMSAEAIMKLHEALAKTVEDMREPLNELATQHQNALADLAAAVTYINETAQRCRAVGENSRDAIQKSSETIAECRALCDALRAKIDHPVAPSGH